MSGIASVTIAYSAILFCDASLIASFKELVSHGDAGAIANLVIAQILLILGIWSHLSCMLTEPG